ncbi:hypothetical protein IH724_22460 [Escherichia coli]|nr:hypothetical protein B0915_17760 [Escherichia coli]ELC33458.1 hypothetical protein WE9_05256 [Escherichia coli KTE21]EOU59625.1 hypothetical protein WE7_05262 [Escherichia coli KTE20]ETE13781.1 hypothetical protein V415_26245 [Escherichia coli LAU-EC10]OYK77020.1 hypothetical protein CI719_08140 [Shigella boydii]
MNDDMDFSVNYEQLTQAAEQLLSRCKPTPNTPSDCERLNKACGICELWHHLALRGVRDISGFRRINADRERFNDFLQIK